MQNTLRDSKDLKGFVTQLVLEKYSTFKEDDVRKELHNFLNATYIYIDLRHCSNNIELCDVVAAAILQYEGEAWNLPRGARVTEAPKEHLEMILKRITDRSFFVHLDEIGLLSRLKGSPLTLWTDFYSIVCLPRIYFYCSGRALDLWNIAISGAKTSPCKPRLIVQ